MFQDCLVIPVGRAQRDQWAFLEQLGWKERKERGDLLDRLVQMVKEVQMVHVGEEEHEVQQGSLEPRALLVMTAHQVPQEREALKDRKGAMERLGQRDQMALLEKMGCRVTQVNEESQDFKERLVPLGPQEWLDHRAKLGRLDPPVTGATQVPQDLLESKVCQELQAKKGPREIQAPQGSPGRVVLLGGVDSEEKEAYLAFWALLV